MTSDPDLKKNESPAVSLPMRWVGIDIGGANIKVFLSPRQVFSVPFPMWKRKSQLSETLAELFTKVPHDCGIAVTMTGELADGFVNRKQGVELIVASVKSAAGRRSVVFYSNSPGHPWLGSDQATLRWIEVAAANWHAIASFSGRLLPLKSGFLIDIGSTTTDVIPICEGQAAARGKTDFERLRSSELFYCGVQRTAVCSLCDSFEINHQAVSVAREFFATIEDALILTGDLAESQLHHGTADGRPASRAFAAQRLARMVCNDVGHGNEMNRSTDGLLNTEHIIKMANQVVAKATDLIREAVETVVAANPNLPKHFVVSGQGEWLATRILNHVFGQARETDPHSMMEIVSLSDRLGPAVSQSAAAYAIAVLANEMLVVPSNLDGRLNLTTTLASDSSPASTANGLRVIKIGGSLLNWNSLKSQIEKWLERQPVKPTVWIVGGGELVDILRIWDQTFFLTEHQSHWMSLDLMSITTRLMASQFADWPICHDWPMNSAAKPPENCFLDFAQWLKNNEHLKNKLPESWNVTSDSCAAFFAHQKQAAELVLLKSCNPSGKHNLNSLKQGELVDQKFCEYATFIPIVRLINLRDVEFTESTIFGT